MLNRFLMHKQIVVVYTSVPKVIVYLKFSEIRNPEDRFMKSGGKVSEIGISFSSLPDEVETQFSSLSEQPEHDGEYILSLSFQCLS